MKRILLVPILLPLAVVCDAAPPIRDAATHEQLALALTKARQNDPMARLKPTAGPDPSTAHPVKDLVSESDILMYNGIATLVPKRAILHIPKSVAARVNQYKNGSRILVWADFYQMNRGWISTHEVTRRQAEGKDPIDPEFAQRMGKSANLVVATFAGGPISILPPQPEKEVAQNPNP